MYILCGFITSTIVATRVLKSRPWPVTNRPPGGRRPSRPVARTVRPPSADSPDPDRAMHFFSLWLWWLVSTIHLWMSATFIAVVWVVSVRSLQVASNQSALVQMMLTTLQLLIQRPNLQLGALNLWTLKTFLIYILTTQLISQDGHFQRGGFLWLNTAQGELWINTLCHLTPMFNSSTLSSNLMFLGAHWWIPTSINIRWLISPSC